MIRQDYRLRISRHGNKEYFYKNKFHRLDGPAIVWPDHFPCDMYLVNGSELSLEYFYTNYYQKHD